MDEQDRPLRPLQVFGCDEWLKPKRVYELGHDGTPVKYLVKILTEKKMADEIGHFLELYGTKGLLISGQKWAVGGEDLSTSSSFSP